MHQHRSANSETILRRSPSDNHKTIMEDNMTKNMGTADRVIRTIAAVVIGVLLLNGTISGTLSIILGLFAVIFLATSVISFCTLYATYKIATRGKEAAVK